MRITNHPILKFNRGKKVKFIFNGNELEGYEGESIAAALHANGVKVLSYSLKNKRFRGFYCAIGNCSSCLMEVNGEANVRTCTKSLKEGMIINNQIGKGEIL